MSSTLQDMELWGLSDSELLERLASAEAQERAARIRAFECRFHQAIRRNMKKQEIQGKIEALEAEAKKLRALI